MALQRAHHLTSSDAAGAAPAHVRASTRSDDTSIAKVSLSSIGYRTLLRVVERPRRAYELLSAVGLSGELSLIAAPEPSVQPIRTPLLERAALVEPHAAVHGNATDPRRDRTCLSTARAAWQRRAHSASSLHCPRHVCCFAAPPISPSAQGGDRRVATWRRGAAEECRRRLRAHGGCMRTRLYCTRCECA